MEGRLKALFRIAPWRRLLIAPALSARCLSIGAGKEKNRMSPLILSDPGKTSNAASQAGGEFPDARRLICIA